MWGKHIPAPPDKQSGNKIDTNFYKNFGKVLDGGIIFLIGDRAKHIFPFPVFKSFLLFFVTSFYHIFCKKSITIFHKFRRDTSKPTWLFDTRKRSTLVKIIVAIGAGSSGVSCFRRLPYHPQPQGESFQALVRHSQPDTSHREREHRRPCRNTHGSHCRPLSSPHLVTRLYHGNPKKSTEIFHKIRRYTSKYNAS